MDVEASPPALPETGLLNPTFPNRVVTVFHGFDVRAFNPKVRCRTGCTGNGSSVSIHQIDLDFGIGVVFSRAYRHGYVEYAAGSRACRKRYADEVILSCICLDIGPVIADRARPVMDGHILGHHIARRQNHQFAGSLRDEVQRQLKKPAQMEELQILPIDDIGHHRRFHIAIRPRIIVLEEKGHRAAFHAAVAGSERRIEGESSVSIQDPVFRCLGRSEGGRTARCWPGIAHVHGSATGQCDAYAVSVPPLEGCPVESGPADRLVSELGVKDGFAGRIIRDRFLVTRSQKKGGRQ